MVLCFSALWEVPFIFLSLGRGWAALAHRFSCRGWFYIKALHVWKYYWIISFRDTYVQSTFFIFAYLDIFCSLGVNFSLFLFLIILYCSHFSVLSSRCSEMCIPSPAISVLCKFYNGRSFSSRIGCFTWSCHVFLILYSTILVLRNCFA